MDLREIIKWFIPCFHILLKFDARMTLIWLLLFCNLCPAMASVSELEENNSNLNNTKNIVSYVNNSKSNQSEVYNDSKSLFSEVLNTEDTSIGRTFGRPMKKMMQALIPLAMAIGSAGTWAVVAALIGAKTLVVTLFILKLLLMAGAAKAVGLVETGLRNRQTFNPGHQATQTFDPGHQTTQLFDPYQRPTGPAQIKPVIPLAPMFGGVIAGKVHHPPHYAPPPSKEIHLHIHNGGHHGHHEEEIIPNLTSWSRDSPVSAASAPSISKTAPEAYNPYLYLAGPQTIRTPYGNYVKVD